LIQKDQFVTKNEQNITIFSEKLHIFEMRRNGGQIDFAGEIHSFGLL
jgi:hypothetical protein